MSTHLNKLNFTANGKHIKLSAGEIYSGHRVNNYRDAPENIVNEITKDICKGYDWRELVESAFEKQNPWLYKIITSKQRTLFFDKYPLKKNSLILDIGSGWGQFTLPLATDHLVCSIEPTPEKLNFIYAAAQQEKKESNIYFISDDFLRINFKTKFDYILSIGVLEWVGSYSDINPYETQMLFLKKIKNELKPDGHLIIGIENRLGLKYLLGIEDDHIGIPDILIHEEKLAKKKYETKTNKELKVFTYSQNELNEMLKSTGFNSITFYAALPDYKIPQVILPFSTSTNNYLKSNFTTEHSGYNGKKLIIQDLLSKQYSALSELEIVTKFVPSFYIVAKHK